MVALPHLYLSLGRKLRSIREAHHLSQGELAGKLNLTRAAISSLERGKQQVYIHSLYAIADVLKIDVKLLLPVEKNSESQLASRLRKEVERDDVQKKILKILKIREQDR